ncbi:glycerate kinase [Faecalicoccus pleomorphus]|uniref:glycerate kinase family protein n=1 Tax=Faecalicoccus pleomorphus TaxID=1323 RepID=UPI00189BDB1B|nr:glycerate kinase [Faecalicoccus pleomorphus]MDB7984228.1 glycerate kinase [Faecalicoccus pleomorphus]
MDFVVACDSFKGCMTAQQACDAVKQGILQSECSHSVHVFPMADGGEGTAEIINYYSNGYCVNVQATDAFLNPICTYYYRTNSNIAIIDVTACIGIESPQNHIKSVFDGSSYGVGLLIKHAIEHGCYTIIIGLGGSCTNDGGMGILNALGIDFLDFQGNRLLPTLSSLPKIHSIYNNMPSYHDIDFIIACDVKNKLLGRQGATYTYGKQKGILESQMAEVDSWMTHYRDQIQKEFHIDINEYVGGGAAGGIGAILLGILNGRYIPGIDLITQLSHIEEAIHSCDVVITGEGATDEQTLFGKVPYGIAQIAKKYHKPVVCLSGSLGKNYEILYNHGFSGIFSILSTPMTLKEALEHGAENLQKTAFSITKLLEESD